MANIDTLLHKLSKGDKAAFAKIYDLYHGKLYRFALSYVKSGSMAEDVVHDVFVKVWDFRTKIRTDTNFDSFLYEITKNHLLNMLRKKKKWENNIDELLRSADKSIDTIYEEDASDMYEAMYEEAIKKMPKRRQQIYLLSRKEGLSYKEIAACLNISPNTVEVHIVRALKTIRSHLYKEGGTVLRSLIHTYYS